MDMLTKVGQLPNMPEQAVAPVARPVVPVMDIKPPQAETPVVDEVHTAPPSEVDHEADIKSSKKTKKVKQPKSVKIQKPGQPGVGGAIFASVVIVLSLSGLAVYAYLKTNNL